MTESSFDETIARSKVERLAQNIRTSAEEVTRLVDADEIDIERLLLVSRLIARTARRISRRANWTIGAPAPGNELTREERPVRSGATPRRDDQRFARGGERSSGGRSGGARGGPGRGGSGRSGGGGGDRGGRGGFRGGPRDGNSGGARRRD